jgi:hypothetical protein
MAEYVNKFNIYRFQLALLAIIVCALSVNVYGLFQSIVFPEKIRQHISGYLSRFSAVQPLLPGRGVVGYISDDLENEDHSMPRKYVAEYALLPVILVRSIDYPLIVGNFRNPVPDLEAYRKQGLVPVRDFGNGVVLFKREHR